MRPIPRVDTTFFILLLFISGAAAPFLHQKAASDGSDSLTFTGAARADISDCICSQMPGLTGRGALFPRPRAVLERLLAVRRLAALRVLVLARLGLRLLSRGSANESAMCCGAA